MSASILTAPVVRWSINQLARREALHVSTCWRWVLHGVRGVKLRSVRIGGRRFVLESDWQEFNAALNADLATVPADPTPAAVSARAEKAGRELDAVLGGKTAKC